MATTAPAEGHELLDYTEAARRLGPSFTPRQIRWHIEQGRLTAVRIGQRTFVRRAELDRMVRLAEGAPPHKKAAK